MITISQPSEQDSPVWETEPARRLWLRVWWRAICDYVLYKDRHETKYKKLAHEAADWIFGESCYGVCPLECDDSRMSFEAFCEHFGKDPAQIRRWVSTIDEKDIYQIGRNLL